MSFYHWLQYNSFIRFVAESDSIWGFPIVLVLHTMGLALIVGTNAIVDLRVLGAGRKIPASALLPIVRVMWSGFGISALSGVILFLTDADHRVRQPVFYVKLCLIALAFVVTYLIRPVLRRGPTAARAKTLAVLSLILWGAVIGAARLMALGTYL